MRRIERIALLFPELSCCVELLLLLKYTNLAEFIEKRIGKDRKFNFSDIYPDNDGGKQTILSSISEWRCYLAIRSENVFTDALVKRTNPIAALFL